MFGSRQAKKSGAAEAAAAATATAEDGSDATKEKKKKKKAKAEGDGEAAAAAEGGATVGEDSAAPKEKMPKLVLRFKKYQFAKNKKAFVQ